MERVETSRLAPWPLLPLLAVIGLLIAAPAWPALQVLPGNPGLQNFAGNGTVQLDFGVTGFNGTPLASLRPDQVKILENGKPARIVDFRGLSQGRPVDIVFVMDVTESMQPYIDAVKQNVIAFVRDLAAHKRDYRLGLVTFEDYVVSKYADCNCAYRNRMTSDVNEFIGWVGSLHASGGGDIPEDQLDALAYAAAFPFRPNAQGILILITDAPCHYAGDGSAFSAHDAAFWAHHQRGEQVTALTGREVAATLKRDGLTLYAVAPPPFIAPQYAEIVGATRGRLYNIVTHESRFPDLVREIGHSIATQYSLAYQSPCPVEDGTERTVVLKVNYEGQAGEAETSYQMPGVGGAASCVEAAGSTAGGGQLSLRWWNGAVPLAAALGLLLLSRLKLGVPRQELEAVAMERERPGPSPSARSAAPRPPAAAASASSPAVADAARPAARLMTVEPRGALAAEYSLLKEEATLGRGTENDLVIAHVSVSRVHARLTRRSGFYEITDLNSTNGTFVDGEPVHVSAVVRDRSEVRLGEARFILRL